MEPYNPHWHFSELALLAQAWLSRHRQKNRSHSERSEWWDFVHRWPKEWSNWIHNFKYGQYRFSPRIRFHTQGEMFELCDYRDRFMLHLLFQQVKSTFSHVISSNCYHLQGPSGVQTALVHLNQELNQTSYRYIIRADIKSYYASIQHSILLQQLQASFSVSIHPRSCKRAWEQVRAMQLCAVHPATQQRYLLQWARWWARSRLMSVESLWHSLWFQKPYFP